MESKTVGLWVDIVNNPNEEFREYFQAEESYLKAALSKGMVVLDIGCGDGRSMKPVSRLVKSFIGIDNDKNAIKAFNENMKDVKNAEVILEDAEGTGFKDRTFDVVFIGLTFCNFGETKQRVLSEIRRILKDGGKFILSVYSEDAFDSRTQMYDKIKLDYKILDELKGMVQFKDGAVSEQFSMKDMKRMLAEAGFVITGAQSGSIFHIISAKKL